MTFKVQTLRNSKQGWISCLWSQIKHNFKCYCETTSLHGFHYLTSKYSSVFTKSVFAFAVCCSLILCTYLIGLQLLDHQRQSVLTTVSSTAYPVWKIRFPAVTVCNFNIVYKDNIKNVYQVVKTHGIKETSFINFVGNLSSLIVHENLENFTSYKEVLVALERVGYTTERLMAELAHPCNSMVKKCFWQSEEVLCSQIVQPIKTSQGYCCSFNYYGARNTVHNFNNSQSLHYQYVSGAGSTLGLRLLLDVEEEQYISSIKPLSGFNVVIQDGVDYPDMDLVSNTLLSAEELTISITPRIYDSSENIRNMDIDARNCLFEDEGNLEWSSTYSYKTCVSQCKANAILEYCNCIPYYYPVAKHNRFCTLMDVTCLQNNKYKYSALAVTKSFLTAVEIQSIRDRIDKVIECNCYPQCNERVFEFHTDRGKDIQMEDFAYTNMSILNVYYNTVGGIEISRDVYYTWDRVFASIGGIFGLCLGGSVISILECFYFMGKSVSKSTKTKSKLIESKEPEIYISDFAHHYYRRSFGNKTFSKS